MRRKKYLIALAAVLVLLSAGVAFAATQQPNVFRAGDSQGAYGNGNAGACTDNPIQAQVGSQARVGNDGAPVDPAPAYDDVPDGTLTPALAEMLDAAIKDEFKARAEYEALIAEFGEVRPFTNIIFAEENHIAALTRIFEVYGIALPEDKGDSFAIVPGSLEEALQAGINAEISNIAMYEGFLKSDLPEDVRTVFQSLKDASENHQAAFERRLQSLS